MSNMIVWEVIVSDCESSQTVCICATKEIAVREMFKIRDKLVRKWLRYSDDPAWAKMIKNLSGNDYEEWDNYPHERPRIQQTLVID